MLKKRNFIIVAISLIFLNIFSVKYIFAEHKLENLEINVFVNDDGSASVTEKREAVLSEGTENYIVIENLGKSTIKDFVVEEDGKTYEYVKDWNIDASQKQKTFKNGIVDTKDGYELCWGIGKYGSHKYILKYTITDFVKELQDGQMLFWKFVNEGMNIPPKKATVTIESKKSFNKEEHEIYAFGYSGDIEFVDGKIIARSGRPLNKNNFVTILVGLPIRMFQTNDFIDLHFDGVKDEAFVGSDYITDDSNYRSKLYDNIELLIAIIIVVAIIIILAPILIISAILSKNPLNKTIVKKARKKYKGEYYRDYPYEEKIIDIYCMLQKMEASGLEELLTAFLLKWIKEGRIKIILGEKKGTLKKREQTNIKFLNKNEGMDLFEEQLFSILVEAAGEKDILEEKEFTQWAFDNYKRLEAWEKRVKIASFKKLKKLGYIDEEEKNEKKELFSRIKNIIFTSKGNEFEGKVYKYINYICDYSLLNEQEAVNVEIWDNIMIWAAVLGLTEVAREQFEKLYPKYQAETIYSNNSVYYTDVLTGNIALKVAHGRNISEQDGSGGSSSFGGGGGSFGGGSGGGTR